VIYLVKIALIKHVTQMEHALCLDVNLVITAVTAVINVLIPARIRYVTHLKIVIWAVGKAITETIVGQNANIV